MSRPTSARDKMAQVQWKIRQNATEMQETLKSLSSWEKDIKKKERTMRKEQKQRSAQAAKGLSSSKTAKKNKTAPRTLPAVRGSRGTVVSAASSTSRSSTPAAVHPMLRGRLGAEKTDERGSSVGGADSTIEKGKRKDAHTYDKGYKKWEKFDVDAELARLDAEEASGGSAPSSSSSATTDHKHRP